MAEKDYTPEEWARMIKENWEKRARSPWRDFYIDSRPSYDDPQVWDRFAKASAELILTNVEKDELETFQVLDFGCGVGRLAPYIAPFVQGYTGLDIAPGMVEEASKRSAKYKNCRFYQTDGLTLPEEAKDRFYDLAFALAVFIHCPRQVIASIVKNAFEQLRPGGELRFQVLADPNDRTGIVVSAHSEEIEADLAETQAKVTKEQMELIEGHYYMGDHFLYDEVEPFMKEAAGGEVELVRMDPSAIYGVIRKSHTPGVHG